MSLGSIVKAAEPYCDEFAPSSPAQGRVRIVNSIDPAKNSTFLRRRRVFACPRTGIVNRGDLSLRTRSRSVRLSREFIIRARATAPFTEPQFQQ
jgi:hypothetical protein